MAQHVDDMYCIALFTYMKEMAVRYRVCLDDKSIIPVGDPGLPISTGVRAHHKGLTVLGQHGLLCLDHDYHVACIVPSVCFQVDIPEHQRDSWYNGQVYLTVKDNVFEPSSPIRLANETVSILHELTDVGPDHRTTFKSIQL